MKRKITGFVLGCLFMFPLVFPLHIASAQDLTFLSFQNPEMISFDLLFKQYMASYKIFIEKDKGLKALSQSISKWNALSAKAKNQGADEKVLGRMTAIKGLLIQTQGLARQGRFNEATELSTPIRTELYELHRGLDMLTAEDHMIFFHNGVIHRAEPLIEEGRYLELQMLIPLIEETVARFKTPPKGATNLKQYNMRYGKLAKNVKVYTSVIRQINKYVDPEYGGYMLSTKIADTHLKVTKSYGAIYLSFPKGMVWPKKRK
jgi:hypothetical protein